MQQISKFFYERIKTQSIFLHSSDNFQLLRLADFYTCLFLNTHIYIHGLFYLPSISSLSNKIIWFSFPICTSLPSSAAVERGMHLWTDARDWLGGYPYEAATPFEVDQVMAGLKATLVHRRVTQTLGCNEFLYRASATTD